MPIAFQQIDRGQLDGAVAGLAQQVRDSLTLAKRLKVLLDLQNDAALEAMGYSVDDIYLLRVIVQDLADLANLGTGLATRDTQKDFLEHSNTILGLH